MTNEERIKADALYHTKYGHPKPKTLSECKYTSYIAGATAENNRAQALVDALEWIKTYGPCDELTVKFIDKQLEQWKGKEVTLTNDKCRCIQPNWNAFTGKCLTCAKP